MGQQDDCRGASRCRAADFTLRGLVAKRDLKVDCHSVWAFVHAEKLSHKQGAYRG
jgi:putative transposase